MSAAKPTPRYVQPIRPNIELVGGSSPAAEAQVIPIRRGTPAFVPVVAPPATPTRRRRKARPVARRPWEVLVVSPAPGRPTRTVTIRRWQARLVVGLLAITFMLAAGATAAIVIAVQNPELLDAPADAEQLRAQVSDLEDSLATARDDLSESEIAQDSLTEIVERAARRSPEARAKSLAQIRARRASVHAHAAEMEMLGSDDEGGGIVAVGPVSAEGLPVVGHIASGFSRSRRHPILHILRPHLGVDVAAPSETPIVAPAPGRVRFVGRKFGFGLVVEIQHPNRVVTRYAHLKSALVKVGDEVQKGVLIATVGRSGITTGPHLHYEVLVHGRQVDPLRFRIPQPQQSEPPAVSSTPAAPAAPAGATGGSAQALSHDDMAPLQVAPMPR